MGYFKQIKLQPKLNWKYELLEWVIYFVGYKWSKDAIYVPEWFETDWASIPAFFRWLLWNPFDTKFIASRLCHDYLYETCRRSREESDSVFKEILLEAWVNKFKAFIMFLAVRLFWKKYYRKQINL